MVIEILKKWISPNSNELKELSDEIKLQSSEKEKIVDELLDLKAIISERDKQILLLEDKITQIQSKINEDKDEWNT